MQNAVDVAQSVDDRGGVEQVQVIVRRHRQLVARGSRQGLQRSAEHTRSPGYQQLQR
jgi:hypothetical protein